MSNDAERILVVDDSDDAREVIERNLLQEGYSVVTASDAAEAARVLEAVPVSLVITDLKMPGAGGMELVRHVRARWKDTGIIMITGYASIETAVEAVKEGAEDYLSKPFTDSELLTAVRATLQTTQHRRALRAEAAPASTEHYGLLGGSKSMEPVYRAITMAAATSETVLITGESGTGKELAARAIHYSGKRAAARFVPVNCGGIPEGLVESELFGHVKGAFTGAVGTRAGFFMTADGGTIFLDEVGELSLPAQAKLLRVLEDGLVQMVGASRPHSTNVRIIAATNRDLASLVHKKVFRDDLFFRLNVLTIDIPPLRERGDDVLLLIGHFTGKCAEELDKPAPRFSDGAINVLLDYRWPGNVRELANVVKRLVLMSDSEVVDVADLRSLMRLADLGSGTDHRSLAQVEAEHIRNVLASVDGNKTRAASILGIDRKTLREKLTRHELGA